MSERILDQNSQTAGETLTIGRLGETPITVRGLTWLPASQLLLWAIMTRSSRKNKPEEGFFWHVVEGALTSSAILGAEWSHNIAHVLLADWIGKPMDELRIQAGMPRCFYNELNDSEVSPREHVIRALGGPIINLLLLPVAALVKFTSKPGTISRETAKVFHQTNQFLFVVSLLPIPGIDGGPVLKWSLVEKGCDIEEADRAVQQVNGPLSIILGLFSSWSFLKNKKLLGLFSGLLALISLGVFTGLIKEDEIPM
ncbi:MAG: hypothetical protein MUO54_03355 [Anaerolineales bacterium]|nr:hypothetical protein [Anaerolineales bacterium]